MLHITHMRSLMTLLNEHLWIWVARGLNGPAPYPSAVLGPANWSWKWLSTPAGCCSCGCPQKWRGFKGWHLSSPNSSAHMHARKWPRECGSTPVRMNQHTYTQLRVILRKGQCRGARGAPCVTLMWTTGASLGLCLHLPYVFNRASIVQVAWKRFIITLLLCGSLILLSFFSAIMCVDIRAYSISSTACAQVVWDVVFPTFVSHSHWLCLKSLTASFTVHNRGSLPYCTFVRMCDEKLKHPKIHVEK